MAVSSIARVRFFAGALAAGLEGCVIGAGTTFILGLGVILIGSVIYTSPSAVVQFTAGYPLILLLFVSSCFAGMAFFVWRVYLYRKRFLVFPEARPLRRHTAYPLR
jgi:hypothetical protein